MRIIHYLPDLVKDYMKVLVSGSRHYEDYERVKEVLDAYSISHIIHGGARGADRLAGQYGTEMAIPVTVYPAAWDLHGKRAGPIRNTQMLKEGKPDIVVAFLASNSRGTRNMIDQSQHAGIYTKIITI